MNSAHIPTYAAPGTPARRAVWRLARAAAAAGVLAIAGMGAAQAQHGHGGWRDDPQAPPPQQRFQPPAQQEGAHEQRFDPRTFDSREFDDVRARRQQAQQEQNPRPERHSRMTPDERRDLRRQINEAGMDLYPNRPHR